MITPIENIKKLPNGDLWTIEFQNGEKKYIVDKPVVGETYLRHNGNCFQTVVVEKITRTNYPKIKVYYHSKNEWKSIPTPWKKDLYHDLEVNESHAVKTLTNLLNGRG